MKKTAQPPVTIIGAGLTGIFLAIQLAKRNKSVIVYEKMSEEMLRNNASKKSFNLTFYNYAINVFKNNGLWDVVNTVARPLECAITFISARANTKPVESWYDPKITPCYVVQRSELMKVLIDYAEKQPTITIKFNHTLVGCDEVAKTVTIANTVTKKKTSQHCEVLFGADGLHSTIRNEIQRTQKSSYKEERSPWSYKQVTIPQKIAHEIGMSKQAMYAWTRRDSSFVALPNSDGTYNGMLVTQTDGQSGLTKLTDTIKIEQFIISKFPHLIPGIEIFKQELKSNPESFLTTINTTPWYSGDFMCILGDAAHALFPFSGQGMSAGFGDVTLLMSLLDKYDSDWHTIFSTFETHRKPHTDALVTLSKMSFELFRRDKKADFNAVYDKLISILHNVAPAIVKEPIFFRVMQNPDRTAEYFDEYKRQKKTILFSAVSLAATIITGVFAAGSVLNKRK